MNQQTDEMRLYFARVRPLCGEIYATGLVITGDYQRADYVLREKKNLMRVYIYTSYENKYDNCVNNLSMTPREAKKMIRDVDQARIAYHMRYAGYMPDENKDIQIDSAFLGVEGTAWYLCQAAKHRFGVE